MRGIEREAGPKTARGVKSTVSNREKVGKPISMSRIRCPSRGEEIRRFMASAVARRDDTQRLLVSCIISYFHCRSDGELLKDFWDVR